AKLLVDDMPVHAEASTAVQQAVEDPVRVARQRVERSLVTVDDDAFEHPVLEMEIEGVGFVAAQRFALLCARRFHMPFDGFERGPETNGPEPSARQDTEHRANRDLKV